MKFSCLFTKNFFIFNQLIRQSSPTLLAQHSLISQQDIKLTTKLRTVSTGLSDSASGFQKVKTLVSISKIGGKLKIMEQTEPNQEKTELVKEKTLEDLPVEVLVKIFNYLRNHNIRCGISLACKKFLKICQNESFRQIFRNFLQAKETPQRMS